MQRLWQLQEESDESEEQGKDDMQVFLNIVLYVAINKHCTCLSRKDTILSFKVRPLFGEVMFFITRLLLPAFSTLFHRLTNFCIHKRTF